ncbi:hypothetical protein J5N97_010102 [Dioscorea zingiberensis]|uniref:Uncharacterized protein n=1 Tax=Dioscorea zingiberensis TaxID=325984 RepID=A0A9D5CZJ5_9LILI|nr:hypothetical protein J5N97_010102 [Dioscorea zingiberensis]
MIISFFECVLLQKGRRGKEGVDKSSIASGAAAGSSGDKEGEKVTELELELVLGLALDEVEGVIIEDEGEAVDSSSSSRKLRSSLRSGSEAALEAETEKGISAMQGFSSTRVQRALQWLRRRRGGVYTFSDGEAMLE